MPEASSITGLALSKPVIAVLSFCAGILAKPLERFVLETIERRRTIRALYREVADVYEDLDSKVRDQKVKHIPECVRESLRCNVYKSAVTNQLMYMGIKDRYYFDRVYLELNALKTCTPESFDEQLGAVMTVIEEAFKGGQAATLKQFLSPKAARHII
jgi:hypothetical protein